MIFKNFLRKKNNKIKNNVDDANESKKQRPKQKEQILLKNKLSTEVINKISDRYDRQTVQIMSQVLKEKSNCIDIGAAGGYILKYIINLSPLGNHFAFEPIPQRFEELKENFSKVKIYNYALSNSVGDSTFCLVENEPSYSGLKEREYPFPDPSISKIKVRTNTLDNLFEKTKIDFIKIDVEGAERLVIEGGIKMLRRDKPYVIFEFGKGAANFYNTDAEDMYELICSKIGLKISVMEDWLNKKDPLSESEFKKQYGNNLNYYFIAHP